MAFSNLTDHIDDLNENIQGYVSSMLEYYKLDAFKKLSKGSSMLVQLLVLGSVFLFFLAFISVGLALLIGNALESYSAGFFIMGGFYLLVFFLFLNFRKELIDKFLLQKFSDLVFNDTQIEDVLEERLKDKTVKNPD